MKISSIIQLFNDLIFLREHLAFPKEKVRWSKWGRGRVWSLSLCTTQSRCSGSVLIFLILLGIFGVFPFTFHLLLKVRNVFLRGAACNRKRAAQEVLWGATGSFVTGVKHISDGWRANLGSDKKKRSKAQEITCKSLIIL